MSDDFDDPYLAEQRRKALIRNVIIGALLVGAVATVFVVRARKAARVERVLASSEALMELGTFEDLRDAAKAVAEEASGDDLAPAAFHIQGLKADLAIWALYNGSQSQAAHAEQLLEAAKVRGPLDHATQLGEALMLAIRGDTTTALSLLGIEGRTGPEGPWQAVARSEASLRSGDIAGARAALGGCTVGLCLAWSARIAMDTGEWDAAAATADVLLEQTPTHSFGLTARALALPEGPYDAGRVKSLQRFMESTELPPLLSARVVVALTRALRRSEGSERADALLEQALEASPESTLLAREVSRSKRYQGYFGAAWTRADKALRSVPTDPGLIAELSSALYFNDAAELLLDRLEPARRSGGGDGVRRGDAIVSLTKGLWGTAIEGLVATRHLGEPGDADLYLAEAYLGAGKHAQAADAARRAWGALSVTFGADSREAAVAKMYEGLAVGLGGDPEAADAILEAAYSKDVRTVWGAWLYARYHKGMNRPREAKDAYLIACHNGQDFALACLALAEIYDSLQMDAIMRRTQQEARRQYLRQSPKGWNAPRVKAALQ